MAGAFLEQARSADDAAIRRRLEWLVRVVVSLLTVPGGSEEEERDLVARFVVPGVLADSGPLRLAQSGSCSFSKI